MGRYFSMYVGPYLKSKSTEVEQTLNITTCSNVDCAQHGKTLHSKFCPTCGSASGKLITKTTKQGFHHYQDIYESAKDLRSLGYLSEELASYEIYDNMCWVCNKDNNYSESYDCEDEYVVDTPDDVSDIIAGFQTEYQPLIDYMKAKYNLDMTVHFGTIITWR